MKNGFIFGLLILAGFSNAALAAQTSLTTTGNWQYITPFFDDGDTAAPATWTYDTDLSVATPVGSSVLPSGGTTASYHFNTAPYLISGTGRSGSFNGLGFTITIVDNSIAAQDFPLPGQLDLMRDHNLDPNMVGDALVFSAILDYPTARFELIGMMIFDKDFFSTPVVELPPANVLLDQALFTYANVSLKLLDGQEFVDSGEYARYATSPSAVPVPAAAFMLAPALLGFLGLRRKAKSSAA